LFDWLDIMDFPLESSRESAEEMVVDWIYNFGPRQFIYTVTFEGRRVVRIESGDYGW